MSDDNGAKTDDDDTTTDDTKSSDTGGKEEAPKTVSVEEYEALKRRMQAADRTATEANNKLAEIENAKKDEVTRAKDDLARALEENARLKEENRKVTMRSDFLGQNLSWHNPSTAYNTLLAEYPDLVTVEDDGKVTGMKAAVEKLAKEHSYLVKKESTGEEEDDQASAATASTKNGKRKGDGAPNEAAVKEAMLKRLPALAARTKK
jgi:hypothetical protein